MKTVIMLVDNGHTFVFSNVKKCRAFMCDDLGYADYTPSYSSMCNSLKTCPNRVYLKHPMAEVYVRRAFLL